MTLEPREPAIPGPRSLDQSDLDWSPRPRPRPHAPHHAKYYIWADLFGGGGHEAGCRRNAHRHCRLRTETAAARVCPRSRTRRADPRDPDANEYSRLPWRIVRRRLHRGPE